MINIIEYKLRKLLNLPLKIVAVEELYKELDAIIPSKLSVENN